METERVTLVSDTPGQELSLRVFRFRGSGNGPAVYIQGALHSHEMPGMAAIDRLIPRLAEAERDARFAATVELRGMIDVTPEFAERDAGGLYRYLVDIGTVIDELPAIFPIEPIIGDVDAAQLIPTPVPDALLYDIEIGDWVSAGQRLAVILSEPGTAHHEIRSPFDGQVMTRRDRPFVRRGDYIIKILCHPLP